MIIFLFIILVTLLLDYLWIQRIYNDRILNLCRNQ